MMGRDHIIVNTETLIVAGSTTCALLNCDVEPIHKFIEADIHLFLPDPSIPMVLMTLGLFYLGTLLPDADSPHSIIGRHIHLPGEHRTWTHTIWMVILFAVLSIVLWAPLWGLTIGYFLHIFWDSFSREGICWCWPLSRYQDYASGARVKRHHIFKFYRTNGTGEYVILIIMGIASALTIFVCIEFGWYAPLISWWKNIFI